MKKYLMIILCIVLGCIAFILVEGIGDNNMNTPKKKSSQEQVPNDDLNEEEPEPIEEQEPEPIEEQEPEPIEEQKPEIPIVEDPIVDEDPKKELTEEDITKLKTVSTFKEQNYERYIEYKTSNPNLSNEEIIMRVNVYLDYGYYQKTIEALNKNTPLILVNKYYYIDETYIPDNLVEVPTTCASSGGIYADNEATTHFIEMCNDAKALGLTIKTISAYRSYSYQNALYTGYLRNDTVESVDTYSARAGHSEHQTGYAYDVYNGQIAYTSFGDTEEFKWVKINAHKYGFIIRYTEANSYITGYKNEPWHLRYVGVNAATSMNEHNITLEEYLLNKK